MKQASFVPRYNHGFSLVEVMASLAITLMIMVGLFTLMVQNSNIYQGETQSADMQQSLRVAMDMIMRGLRHAGRNPTNFAFDSGHQSNSTYCPDPTAMSPASEYTYSIITAAAQGVRVRADLPVDEDGDGVVDRSFGTGEIPSNGEDETGDGCINDEGEDVEFAYDPATRRVTRTLRKGTTVTTQPIADMIEDLSFTYLDQNGNVIAAPVTTTARLDIRTIRVTVEAKGDRKDAISKKKKDYRIISDIALRDIGSKVKP